MPKKSNPKKQRKSAPVDSIDKDVLVANLHEFSTATLTIAEFLQDIAESKGVVRQHYFYALFGLVWRWSLATEQAMKLIVDNE